MNDFTRILLADAQGMLGGMLQETAGKLGGFEVFAYSAEDLVIYDRMAVQAVMEEIKPHWVISCAAYYDLDGSETNREEALRFNVHGPQILGEAAANCKAKMLHFSTDLVFDGDTKIPYTEEDLTAPNTVYGKTKRMGELALLQVLPEALIMRTGWLFGPYGANYITLMLNEGLRREEIFAVEDQYGTPTFSGDVVNCALKLMQANATGLYHYANTGVCNLYDFTTAIFEEARALGAEFKLKNISGFKSLFLKTAAKRPNFAVLDASKCSAFTGCERPFWRDSLHYFMQNYIEVVNGRIITNLYPDPV